MKIFLDSGAFSIYKASIGRNASAKGKYTYKGYLKAFKRLLRKVLPVYDICVNLDVIGDEDATFANQEMFESKRLNVRPVWHVGNDDRNFEKRYKDKKEIAFGGFGKFSKPEIIPSCDKAFDTFLKGKKVHGFGITDFDLMRMYPWDSVDSTSWVIYGGYGYIMVPRKKHGEYDFTKRPFVVAVTHSKRLYNYSFFAKSRMEQEYILEYLDYSGIAFGEFDEEDCISIEGVCNNEYMRYGINMLYYLRCAKQLGITIYLAGTGQLPEQSSVFHNFDYDRKGVLITAWDIIFDLKSGMQRAKNFYKMKKGIIDEKSLQIKYKSYVGTKKHISKQFKNKVEGNGVLI